MEKTWVKDIHDKDQVKSVFLVSKKTATASKSGKPFLALVLRDKTGDLDARVWDRVDELDAILTKGELAQVEGPVTLFQGRPQLRIDSAEKVSPEGIDQSEFAAPPKPAPGDRSFGQIADMIDRLQDPSLKALLRSFTTDETFATEFRRAPAAKSVHHSHPGGLADHTLSVMRLSQRVAEQYPMVDRELMLAGAFLHDIGKLREMATERHTEYTDEGRLVGHLVIAAEMIHEHASKIEGFPRALETHLTHIVLSHHGTLEFGSPRLPQTLEAMLVHYVDEMDSRVGSWLEIMQRDPGENWTDFQKLYGRHLYKGPSPTAHGRAPVERRRKRGRAEKPEKHERPEKPEKTEAGAVAAPAAGEAQPKHEAAARPEGEQPAREKRERAPKEKLTFKPFAALSGPATPAPSETAPGQPEQAQAEASPAATPTPAPAPEGAASGSETPRDSSEGQ